jgi:uncharacterized protein YsxB (DUF464 family)
MVRYKKLKYDSRIGLEIAGHASEYSEHEGKNIVCAAISTVCDMVAIGCMQYDPSTEVTQNNGYMMITCEIMPETIAIISAAMIELSRIKENYLYCFEGGTLDGSKNGNTM